MKILRAPVGMLAGCLLLSCGTRPVDVPVPPEKIHTTYRILAGVSIPSGTVIAAGAVVTKTIEQPDMIVAGVPARVIKSRFA